MAEREHVVDATRLTVKIEHRVGSLAVRMTFSLHEAWTVLFGPSGSGKSTVLRAIAGLVRPDSGHIIYGERGTVLFDSDAKIFVPPHLRPVRGTAQVAWLFPGMTVRENVAYGMGGSSHASGSSTDQEEITDEVLSLFRVQTLAARRPSELSGGERQRVSVARAVASAATFDGPGHAILLLDEPFTGLDGALRDQLALELRDWLANWKVTTLSVTHDVAECFLLGAEVIRVAEGQIIEQGPAERVLAGERERILRKLKP